MMFEAKKSLICLLLINYLLASSCPNMCSGHGSCGKGGVCSCFPGWIDGDCSSRTCPYGHSFVDPTQPPGGYGTLTARASLECSGQGSCDRTSGSCKCFGGYEGVSCDRLSCPSNCNGHGVCTAVKMIDLNEDSHIGSYYENDMSKIDKNSNTPANSNYNGWDADQSYVCVCDGEYSGYDCSEKKCPTGYVENSDCDSPSKSTQTITINADDAVPATNFFVTDKYNCMSYLEYTDVFGRVWYSDAFCVLCATQGTPGGNAVCDNVLGWNDVIGRFPVGTIDASVEIVLSDGTNTGVGENTATKVVATVSFGNQQTGKQTPMRLITNKQLDGKALGSEWCGSCGSGYHGMTTDQLTVKDVTVGGGKVDYTPYIPTGNDIISATVDGIPPLECSRNGLCDRSSGLCKCFEGYYGIACTEQASML